MPPSLPAAFRLAATLLVLASSAMAGEVRPDPDPAWRRAPDMAALVAVLEDWLDAASPWPRRAAPPAVRIVARGALPERLRAARRIAGTTRGLYDPEQGQVWLLAPWSPWDAGDVSVLLHELVHHRQTGARHWVCPGAQEPGAYELQEEWLAERGRALRVNRIAVALAAGCTRGDHHPD